MIGNLLLGQEPPGSLILLIGPNTKRATEMTQASGLPAVKASTVADPAAYKAGLLREGRSAVVVACISEVDGILDRTAFGRPFVDLAWEADRIVYVGMETAALVHPKSSRAVLRLHGGHLSVGDTHG